MEIERKFLIKEMPNNLEDYTYHDIEQGYLCTEPVMRIRKKDDHYFFTYKGKGLMVREEIETEIPMTAYLHLKDKIDGHLIEKRRYIIPLEDLKIELDVFEGDLAPLVLAEVEFPSVERGNAFVPPEWFGRDVTETGEYQNARLSQL